ncbi:MAG: efflux RND transporter permease subunit, partial [Verrucomicrobiota bacterium]
MSDLSSQKGTIAWFAQNPVAANLLLAMVFIAGSFSFVTIPKEIFPTFESPFITISVPYPGASPVEVERGICLKIEEALEDIDGIKQINSTASEGIGRVSVEVKSDFELSEVLDAVNIAVNSVFEFPQNAEKPSIQQFTLRQEVIGIQIYGELDERAMTELA